MTSFHEIFGSFVKTEKLTETPTVAAESPDNTETISVDLGKFGFYIPCLQNIGSGCLESLIEIATKGLFSKSSF